MGRVCEKNGTVYVHLCIIFICNLFNVFVINKNLITN